MAEKKGKKRGKKKKEAESPVKQEAKESHDHTHPPSSATPVSHPDMHHDHAVHDKHEPSLSATSTSQKATLGKNPWQIATWILAVLFVLSLFYSPFDKSGKALPDGLGDTEIEITVLSDKTCRQCDTSQAMDILSNQVFPGSTVTELDYSSKEGKKLAEKYDIEILPAYLLDEGVEKTANFARIQDTLIKKGNQYIIHPAAIGAGKHLNPRKGTTPYFGKQDAPVEIIEFSDFECPFCKRFFEETYPQIKEEYIKTGKVKLYYRDFPLPSHQYAQKAAEAARCAGDQEKYWAMHDEIFTYQDAIRVDELKFYAETIGLDVASFSTCLDTGKYAEEVQKDVADGQAMGVGGTPTFFINGIIISGAYPFEVFKQIIDEQLQEQGEE